MLNLGGGGDWLPYCKYNAKAGRWYAKIDGKEVEVMNPVFVADFAKIQTGWFHFKANTAPSIILDKSLSEPAPKPEATYVDDKGKVRDCYKRGFDLKLFSKNSFGGVVVLNGASMHLNTSINELYEQYVAGAVANPGQLPVIRATGSVPMKDAAGVNYKPTFVIEKWVPRPAEFDEEAAATASASNANAPATSIDPPKAAVSEF
jgi:hypothetical protein